LNLNTPEFHFHSRTMGFTKKLTTGRSPIVRSVFLPFILPTTNVLSIAQRPQCPSGMMQWQHGTYQIHSNGSLTTEPISVDGRQLYSDPCRSKYSVLSRYNQSALFEVTPKFAFHYSMFPSCKLTFTALRGSDRSLPQHSTPQSL
jgi:hypothetical protein